MEDPESIIDFKMKFRDCVPGEKINEINDGAYITC
jgi:hypothetical protein